MEYTVEVKLRSWTAQWDQLKVSTTQPMNHHQVFVREKIPGNNKWCWFTIKDDGKTGSGVTNNVADILDALVRDEDTLKLFAPKAYDIPVPPVVEHDVVD